MLLSGEAGIGKSRLTPALLECLATEPRTRLRHFCSPRHTDSALYPIIGQMERAAGLAHDDKPQAKLDKLDAVLAQTSISTQDAALFAEMLSLPNDGRYPALELTPQQRRQRTLEALVSQIGALTRQSPVLSQGYRTRSTGAPTIWWRRKKKSLFSSRLAGGRGEYRRVSGSIDGPLMARGKSP